MISNMLLGRPLLALLAIGWISTDAARRRRDWVAWALLVSTLGFVTVIAWLFVRGRSPVADALPIGRRMSLWLAAIPFAALYGIVSVFTVTVLIQAARVEGTAMQPTLNDRDRVIVDKLTYHRRDPERGEIVMLRYPLRPERHFVMRVIAEENDTIRIVNGLVYVNLVELDEPYISPRNRSYEDWGPEIVPEGYCAVLGDHRNNSSDSRHGIRPEEVHQR